MKISVNGFDDSAIVLSGDVNIEIDLHPADVLAAVDRGLAIGFSDGTLRHASYDVSGFWRIYVKVAGIASSTRKEAMGSRDISDKLTLTGDFSWIVCGGYSVVRIKDRDWKASVS